MLRVLIGFPFGTRVGGAEEMLWRLLDRRRDAGIDPHVLFFEDGEFRRRVAAEGIATTVIAPGRFREPWRLAAAIVRTALLIRRTKPDLVVSWLPRVQTVLAPAAALTRRRDRVVYFEWELPRMWINRLAVRLPCRWVVACSRSVLAVNQSLPPHRDGTTVWPGIRPPARTSPGELAAMRTRLGLGERPVAGIAGRLVSWKGQDRLIEAAALLRDEGIDLDVLIVGGEAHGVEPGGEARLRELVHRLGLGDRVVFTGHVDPATPYIELMDVFVSASDGEPFGIVILEAMALGVPVVAVAKHGPAEIIEHGVSGLLAPTNSARDLADQLRAMLRDERRGGVLAAAALERYRTHFREDRMIADLRRTLHGLAGELGGSG